MSTLKFTPMHLILFVESYTGVSSRFPANCKKQQYLDDLVDQGLIYSTGIEYKVTAYGARKIEQLLMTMQLPGTSRDYYEP